MVPLLARYWDSWHAVSWLKGWAIVSRSDWRLSWWYVDICISLEQMSLQHLDLFHLHHFFRRQYPNASGWRDPMWSALGCIPDNHHGVRCRGNTDRAATVPYHLCQSLLGLWPADRYAYLHIQQGIKTDNSP